MPSINILDSGTVNQIAAGEVIERPSSVVKELVENALDAGATAVTVEIREGGISLIRVTDNGCGIAAEDIPLAFLRHSTSKIRSVEDLLTVSSLGFRGEALSSIAAVAQVELITRTPESLTGVRYRIEGGEEIGSEEIGAPSGTTFLVRNLFFNTPARRKFLKTAATEGSYISALMERLALSRPDVSFRLLVNNQEKLHTAGNHKLKDIIYTIYGRDITRSLLSLHAETEDVTVDGYIGRPEINRGNRTYENYFVNGRYVRSALITKAIENAYHGFTMQHKYPFVVFHLTIDSALLDVNVHPTKMELRFVREEAVYQAVFQAIRGALTGEELIPRHAFDEKAEKKVSKEEGKPETSRPLRGPEPFETRRRQAEIPREPSTIERMQQNMRNSLLGNQQFQERRDAGTAARGGALAGEHPAQANIVRESFPLNDISPEDAPPAQNGSDTASLQENKQTHTEPEKAPVAEPATPKQLDLFEEKLLTREARAEYHILGQLFDTYWLIQYRDQLLIMDQHAAHEKVLYERTMRSLREKEYVSQQVQPPVILTLNAREIEVVTEYREDFERVGFQIEPFGGREYAVYAVPANLFGIARADLLTEMIDSLADETGHTQMTLVEEKIASMSCKAAVKGNNRLSQREAEALIDELLQLDNPYQCPHGRPTIITMTRYELEKSSSALSIEPTERKEETMQPLIVLAGPTAVGKTSLSIRLAQEIGGEIISADSMQVYRQMNIGTAKVLPEEQQGVPHYLIDCCEPDEEFHVVEYQRAAREALQTIYSHGAIPILTGGTGFYIQVLVRDIDFTETGGDPAYRRGLEEQAAADGGKMLYAQLFRLDPEAAAEIHPHNLKRVIRALEYFHFTGEKISEHNRRERERRSPYNTLYLVLNRDRAELYRRIDQRVDLMLEQGLVAEVESLRQRGYSRHLVSMQGLGYKEIREALEGEIPMEEAIYKLKRDTRHFAKRQLTWFRREPEAVWLNWEDYAGEEEMLAQILSLCRERGIMMTQ